MPTRDHDHANLGGSNRLMSMRDAAALLAISEKNLLNNYARWGLPVVRIGRRVLVRERTLNAWTAARESKAS